MPRAAAFTSCRRAWVPRMKGFAKRPQPIRQQVADLLDLSANLSDEHRNAVKVGQRKRDQLLRALVPMYLIRTGTTAINGGDISRFWLARGVDFSGSNAAGAL